MLQDAWSCLKMLVFGRLGLPPLFWRSAVQSTDTYLPLIPMHKKDTSVTFWAERKKLCDTYDTSMTIIVTKPGIIIDVVGSYFYDKKS